MDIFLKIIDAKSKSEITNNTISQIKFSKYQIIDLALYLYKERNDENQSYKDIKQSLLSNNMRIFGIQITCSSNIS